MARFVLLAFEDNNQAEDFINAVKIQGGVFYSDKGGHFQNFDPDKTFVRGLWAKPTKLCACPPSPKRNYVRGAKFGWYSCTTCAGTHPGWAAGEHLYTSFGKNLLPVSGHALEWRGEGIAHHRFDEGGKQWVHVVTGEPWNPKEAFRNRKDYHSGL